jgi:hypothetical protein
MKWAMAQGLRRHNRRNSGGREPRKRFDQASNLGIIMQNRGGGSAGNVHVGESSVQFFFFTHHWCIERTHMRTDTFTKIILSMIALFLGGIFLNQTHSPSTARAAEQAEGIFAHTLVVGQQGGFLTIDTQTGEIYQYYADVKWHAPELHGKLEKVGSPIKPLH